jgi:WS/DGAT/MGAT family acyltransferase
VLLHDDVPRPGEPAPPEPWFPEEPPDATPLLMRAVANNVIDPLAALKRVTRSVSEAGPAVLGFAGEAIRHPERFPTARFNAEVSPHRVFETRRFTLDDFVRIRRLVRGASIDDAVLAVCGGALRRYLEFHEELPQASLVALAPQSVHGTPPRSSREIDRLHRVALGTDCAEPRERLRVVHEAAARAAEQEGRERRETTIELAESAPAFALALAARGVQAAALAAARGVPIANCTIANLPGPSRPLYLGTARMNYFSAMMPIADGLGLTFAVTNYEGQLVISPTACREQVPDPEFLAQCIRDSFEEYAKLAAPRRVSSRRKPSRSGAKRARRAPRA